MIKGEFTMSMTIALVGNPNCGKTTMFNALTGGESVCWKLARSNCREKRGLFKGK